MAKTWQKLRDNPGLLQKYLIREQIIAGIRGFFKSHSFHEIEVPYLAPALPAESYIEVFESTLLNRLRQPFAAYLTTSPEVFLKKLLVAGVGNCFSLGKSFRNCEDFSNTHNHEFTLLEWYRVQANYKSLMQDAENLFVYLHQQLKLPVKNQRRLLIYQGREIDLTPPWERISMSEAFNKYAHIDLEQNLTLKQLGRSARAKNYQVSERDSWEQLFNQIYLNEIEPELEHGRPVIIYDFPIQVAALARKKLSDPRFVERFEIYIGGLELGDAYSELTDWQEQEARFKAESVKRKRLGKISYPYDQDFITALKVGLPPCAGLALGVDRVIMLFADVARIQDTLFFPTEELWQE